MPLKLGGESTSTNCLHGYAIGTKCILAKTELCVQPLSRHIKSDLEAQMQTYTRQLSIYEGGLPNNEVMFAKLSNVESASMKELISCYTESKVAGKISYETFK